MLRYEVVFCGSARQASNALHTRGAWNAALHSIDWHSTRTQNNYTCAWTATVDMINALSSSSTTTNDNDNDNNNNNIIIIIYYTIILIMLLFIQVALWCNSRTCTGGSS